MILSFGAVCRTATLPGLNWTEANERKVALALFLLEELDLYLAENDNDLFYTLSGGMIQFLDELEQCVDWLLGSV